MRALGAQNREKHYAFHNIMRPWGANKFDKKYLILTFEGEFEKVHYPLPL